MERERNMIERRITPVILCGGIGTRLWPRSRASAPKPFLPLIGPRSLFQEALGRCRESGFAKPIIVTGAGQLQLVDAQVNRSELGEIIIEPEPRHTATAVALAALRLPSDAVMLVCPSDHHIADRAAFHAAAVAGAELAAEGWLACLAIPATDPATRFGYVRAGERLATGGFRVIEFVEKPDSQRAGEFVRSGNYAWNAGIFAFRAGDYLDELAKSRPELCAFARDAVRNGHEEGAEFLPEPAWFNRIAGDSIDRAVMEKTDRAAMVMADMGWSDIGDWNAVRMARDKDDNGNSVHGPAELVDCRNVLVDSDGPRVRAVGLQDVIIVVDGEDILIANAASSLPPVPGRQATADES